jgi:hypothetical protein
MHSNLDNRHRSNYSNRSSRPFAASLPEIHTGPPTRILCILPSLVLAVLLQLRNPPQSCLGKQEQDKTLHMDSSPKIRHHSNCNNRNRPQVFVVLPEESTDECLQKADRSGARVRHNLQQARPSKRHHTVLRICNMTARLHCKSCNSRSRLVRFGLPSEESKHLC